MMVDDAPLLDVSDLTVHFETYEGRQRVLDAVNLTVHDGETVALVGETGCGKSVTAETIMGMLPQPPGEIVDGSVRYEGTELLRDPDRHDRVRADEMSMVFQDPMTHLSPVFTVGSMMADVITYHGQEDVSWWTLLKEYLGRGPGADDDEIRDRCVQMLERLQIPDPEGILDRYPVELSGGMRQRVLIAMALLNDPRFIIVDEPTTALDVTVQEQILKLLSERVAKQNLSMLYITHNLGVARKLADRIYVMYAGTIAEAGRTEELYDAPLHPYTTGLIDSIPKLTTFDSAGIPGQIPDYTEPPSGCRFHPRCPAYMAGTCDVDPPGRFTVGENDHDVACYLYEDGMSLDTALSISDTEVEYGRPAESDRDDLPDADAEPTDVSPEAYSQEDRSR
ncbi:ABC transporter ATP-binding protein [halophilic archaeon]|nr:ABC transporter ATP-binding protein [halophilic archaeon]